MYASSSMACAPRAVMLTPTVARRSMRCAAIMNDNPRQGHGQSAVVRGAREGEDDVVTMCDVRANVARVFVVGALVATTTTGAGAARAEDVELSVDALYAAATETSAASEAAVRDTSSSYTVNWKDILDAPAVTTTSSKKTKASKDVAASVPAPAVVKAQEKKEQEMRQVNAAKSQREEYAAAQRTEKNAAKKARDEAVMAKVEARRAEQRAVYAERERQAAEDLAKFQAERAEQRARMDALAASKSFSSNERVTVKTASKVDKATSTKKSAVKTSTTKSSTTKKKTTIAKAPKKTTTTKSYKQRKSAPAKKRTNKGAIDRYSLRNTRKQRGGSPLALPGFIALAGFTYYLLLQEEED